MVLTISSLPPSLKCSLGWPWTHNGTKDGFKLLTLLLPASACQVLRAQVYTVTPGFIPLACLFLRQGLTERPWLAWDLQYRSSWPLTTRSPPKRWDYRCAAHTQLLFCFPLENQSLPVSLKSPGCRLPPPLPSPSVTTLLAVLIVGFWFFAYDLSSGWNAQEGT